MVDSWGSGAIMGTTAPEIGHAVLQTVAVLTSDAGQREKVVLDCLYRWPAGLAGRSSGACGRFPIRSDVGGFSIGPCN